ncbi:MAG: hypothetical protein LBT80_02915 [Lactobacillaceae bacterium]|nr:hypothetical protein [Lactobacillaceae bacterium]
MKKVILMIIGVIVVVAVGVGVGLHISTQNTVKADVTSARTALADQNWDEALFYYKAAQKKDPSVEARTAIQQLNYVVKGAHEDAAGNYDEAVEQYNVALKVDGALDRVNNVVKPAVIAAEVKAKSAPAKSSSNSDDEESDVTSSTSSTASSSKKSSTDEWTDASSTAKSGSIDLATAFAFTDTQVKAARAELESTVTNVSYYDDNEIKKVMALQIINHESSIQDAYVKGGWGALK